MPSDLERRVAQELRRLGVGDDEPVGIACSGGADSIALVHLLSARAGVAALHVDHNLRDDSGADALFVQRTAEELGLAFDVRSVDLGPQHGPSVEAAAREARYPALTEMAEAAGLVHVLTAHTRDDQAETVLLRLMRGSSLDSIASVRGIFVRPLLDVARSELREWLERRDIAWRDDPTNTDTRYDRNWVRHVLLPQMHDRRPGVEKVLARTAVRAATDEAALDALAAQIVDRAESDDVGIFVPLFETLPAAVASRVIRAACRRIGNDPSDAEVDAVRPMASHVRCGNVDVWRLTDGIAFIASPVPIPEPVAMPASGDLVSTAWGIRLRMVEGSQLVVRSRRPGDRVHTDAGTKKVQDVLVDAKVPRPLRALVPILADDAGAIAVIGSHHMSRESGRVFEVEPFEQTWSRARVWAKMRGDVRGDAWISR